MFLQYVFHLFCGPDCNIVVYQPAKVQCLLMDCGVDSANCYFFEAESKKTNQNNAPVIFKRTKAQVEQGKSGADLVCVCGGGGGGGGILF